MSRSRKKTPVLKEDGKSKKIDKRLANRAVRRTRDLPNGNAYRRVYDQYSICDYESRYTFEQWMALEWYSYRLHVMFGLDATPPNRRDERKRWSKLYLWK